MRALGDPPPPCPASTTFSNCRLLGSAADACDYRGNVSITKSGLTCQLWSEHVPHNHTHVTEEVYPAAGIEEHNFCRNPDRSEPTAWCYTTDPDVRWEERDLAAVRNLLSPFSDAGPRPTLGALGAFGEAATHDSVRLYARKTSPPPQNCNLGGVGGGGEGGGDEGGGGEGAYRDGAGGCEVVAERAAAVAMRVAAARVVVGEKVLVKVEERVAAARAVVGWAAVARVVGTREVEERAGTGTALVDARVVAERAAVEGVAKRGW